MKRINRLNRLIIGEHIALVCVGIFWLLMTLACFFPTESITEGKCYDRFGNEILELTCNVKSFTFLGIHSGCFMVCSGIISIISLYFALFVLDNKIIALRRSEQNEKAIKDKTQGC
jgi:Na+/melibiose symporter-like transporter